MKQGKHMKKILIFISSVTLLSPGLLMAENMMPPSGPYRSIESDILTSDHARNNMHTAMDNQRLNNAQNELPEIPEWVRKRQEDMNNWHKQQNDQAAMQRRDQYMHQSNPVQQQNQNAMQWNQRPPVPMNMPGQSYAPQAVNPQPSQAQINRMKQYFPTSRGPVYGPNVPPPAIYNNPNYQNTAPVNQYPPMWR